MDEFTVRAAANSGTKRYSVFKQHKDDNVSWTEVKMRRENEFQPWQIKIGASRAARRYKAIKEGGVGDNASYFVFYKPKDKSDTYEVCPVEEWYNISATQRYKTLTAEEAEQKFEQRHKMLNFFSVMTLKKNGATDEGSPGQDSKAFKVSELDDWDNSGDDEASGNEGDDSEESKNKIRRKKLAKKEKDDPDDAPDEAKEDSDEGDYEQREVDYMSDSSTDSRDSGEAKDDNDVKGIAEEEALRELLSTDEEEDGENVQHRGSKSSDNKNSLGTVDFKSHDSNGSDDSSDSDDYDVDDEKMDSMFSKKGLPAQLSMMKQEIKQEPEVSISGSRQTNTNKRKAPPEVPATSTQPPKRPCTTETPSSPPNSQEKLVEDLVKKYLSRKPMTLKALLKDIKSKLRRIEGTTPGMDNTLLQTIASIIKRLCPDKQKINDVTYFSLKS